MNKKFVYQFGNNKKKLCFILVCLIFNFFIISAFLKSSWKADNESYNYRSSSIVFVFKI